MTALGDDCGVLLRACPPTLHSDSPRGVAALREIGDAIDAFTFRESATDEEERRFIEQTGAWLALVLIDHVGDGAFVNENGVFRARLRTRAFFDPFAVIDACLDADAPKRFLAEVVGKLEAEANDEGPMSRVLFAFEDTLAKIRPELSVAHRFETTVRLEDGTEIDLRRAIEATRDQGPSAARQAAEKLVHMLPGGQSAEGIPWSEACTRILPRMVPLDFSPSTAANTSALELVPFLGCMQRAFVLQYEGKARYVRKDDLTRWEVDARGATTAAIQNLAARSSKARFARFESGAGVRVIAKSGDGLDSARLLLPALYDVLSKELGEHIWVAVPHRDTLHACAAAPGNRAPFAREVEDTAQRAPHRISATILSLTQNGLETLR